jgi:hypothetical protein
LLFPSPEAKARRRNLKNLRVIKVLSVLWLKCVFHSYDEGIPARNER